MSKSLEALEELKDEIIPDYALEYEDDEGYKDWVIELYNIIKQDLEHLEEINKVWHDNEPMESVDINGKHLQDLYDYNEELFNKNLELDKKVIELEKENKELETTLLEYKAQENLYWNTATNNVNLREENDKLKKAIEILKNKMLITVNIPYVWFEDKDNCLYFKVNQQEYELLKEVLGDE